MSGGFFRGTSAEQDTRFSNKTAKLLKTQKFAPELDQLVDMNKVKMDAVRPWIATRTTQLLGFEDEVLINFIYGLLEGKHVDGKQIQIQLTGFMEKNTGRFMRELWSLLTSAQSNMSGIPQQFLDEKAEETRKKKAEDQRIVSEFRKKEEDKRDAEQERSKMQNVSSEVARMVVPGAVKSPSSRSPAGFSGDRSSDGIHGHAKNGSYSVSKHNQSGEVSPIVPRHGKEKRMLSRSRSRSGSMASQSVSRSPRPSRRHVSRSVSRSPRRVRRSRSPPRRGRSPIFVRSPRRRRSPTYSRSPPRRRKSPIPWSPPRSRRRSPRYIRSPPRRRPPPSPSPRRRQAPSISPRRHATLLSSPRRRPSSQSPRRRPAPPQSPQRRRAVSKSPRRRQGPSVSPERRPALSLSPQKRLAPSSSPYKHDPSISPRRHLGPSVSPQLPPGISQSLMLSQKPSFSSQRFSSPSSPRQHLVTSVSPSRHIVRSVHSPPHYPAPSSSSRQNQNASISPSRSPSPLQTRSRSIADSSPPNMRSTRKSPFPDHVSLSKECMDLYNGIDHTSGSVENQGKKRPRSPSRDSSISAEKRHGVIKRSGGFGASVHTIDSIRQEKLEEPSHLVSKSSDDDHFRGSVDNQKVTRDMCSDGEEYIVVASPSNTDERKAAKKRRKEEKRLRKEEKRKKREEKQRRKEGRRAAKAAAKAIPSVTPPPDLDNSRFPRINDLCSVDEGQKSEEDDTESEQRRIENELRKKALDSIRAKKGVTS